MATVAGNTASGADSSAYWLTRGLQKWCYVVLPAGCSVVIVMPMQCSCIFSLVKLQSVVVMRCCWCLDGITVVFSCPSHWSS